MLSGDDMVGSFPSGQLCWLLVDRAIYADRVEQPLMDLSFCDAKLGECPNLIQEKGLTWRSQWSKVDGFPAQETIASNFVDNFLGNPKHSGHPKGWIINLAMHVCRGSEQPP